MTTKIDWSIAIEAVNNAASILVVTHVNPDGDAIGSLLGLATALREMGKQVQTAVDGGAPDFLHFIPGARLVQGKLKRGRWDVMVSVDASDEERTGLVGQYGRKHSKLVINLDHHPTNTLFGDIHLVMPDAVSATEIVFDWLERMKMAVSEPVAVALLTGLVTDTIAFRTSNVTARTLEIAASLIRSGASLYDITNRTMVSRPYSHLELWKQAFPSVERRGSLAYATVTQENLKVAGIADVTDGGLVSALIAPEEIAVAAVFKQLPDGRVEMSFRSKVGYDVGTVAFELGGGGHKQAAGATIPGPLEEARAKVLVLLEAVARQENISVA
jgi:phosphoesterase RecJ-like protein